MNNPTPEQIAVINHPAGKHAKVLAVAGSGKTSTMAYRIKQLIEKRGTDPKKILVLIYNRLAKEQFDQKLVEIGLEIEKRPAVQTFHSFASTLIQKNVRLGKLPKSLEMWADDKAENAKITLLKAINNLETKRAIPIGVAKVDACELAITWWKSMLIPPDLNRAGHHTEPLIPMVYQEFEKLRNNRSALTFDDLVPMALAIMKENNESDHIYDHIIVDEYQDVNYGQQKLIESLAGTHAEVMVVGDDDQTIYEWRGARPDYIQKKFELSFNNKPVITYCLSHSFRFGPLIAQSAENVISFNQTRTQKNLVAHDVRRKGNVSILCNSSEQSTDIYKEMTQKIFEMVKETKDPRQVVILCRMFSQLSGIEAEFLSRKIPYRVLGNPPFFERNEIQRLMDYLYISINYKNSFSKADGERFERILNVPNRKLGKEPARRMIEKLRKTGSTFEHLLASLASQRESPYSIRQRIAVDDLASVLSRANELVNEEPTLPTHKILTHIIDSVGYENHYKNYFGEGFDSIDRLETIKSFLLSVRLLAKSPQDTIDHIESLDSTQGKPKEEQILMTTIYRTKGLEFDYVFVPDCNQGKLPSPSTSSCPVYDLTGEVVSPQSSPPIEVDRRLFYVATTRARKGVFFGTSEPPCKGNQSQSNPTRRSQFLDELQLEGALPLIDTFQDLADGKAEALAELKVKAKQFGGFKRVVNNLTNYYLPEIDQRDLASQIVNLVSNIEAVVIPPKSPPIDPKPGVPKKPEEKPWWEDD
jgi:DNA helicase-2/ATP-dependent DNA helicase PcrA